MDASSHIDRLIADLAESQHGVATREQLFALGLGRGALGHRVSRGSLHVIHAGVYAVGHAVLTADGRRMAAVLACGDGAALSHQSAGERHGLLRDQGGRHHVSIRDRSGRDRDGIRIHRPRTLTEDELTTVDGIPITTVERTLLDLAAVVTRTRLERACDEAERQGAVDWAQTLLLVDRHRGHRGAGRLHRVLVSHGIATERTRSNPERRFLALVREHGLPEPDVNVQIDGYLVDFSWPDRRLVVEVDPHEFHRTRFRIEADKRRDAALLVAGWRTYRVTEGRLDDEPDALATHLGTLLAG